MVGTILYDLYAGVAMTPFFEVPLLSMVSVQVNINLCDRKEVPHLAVWTQHAEVPCSRPNGLGSIFLRLRLCRIDLPTALYILPRQLYTLGLLYLPMHL